LNKVLELGGLVHPVGIWILVLLLRHTFDLPVVKDMDVHLSKDHCLPDILQLGPGLGDYILREVVVVSAQEADFEVILLGEDHVDQDAVSDHHKRHEITEAWSFPLDDGEERDDQS
jgi:hypothetical protein